MNARFSKLLAACPKLALRAGEACAAGDVSGATLLIVENGLVVVLSRPRANRRMVLALSAGGMVLPPPSGDEQLVALADSTLIAVAADVQRAMLELPATAEAIVAALLEA